MAMKILWNIWDLVKYIQHENCDVEHGTVSSVFDLLYSCYEKEREEYLRGKKRVSEYTSENLMYAKIEEILSQNNISNCIKENCNYENPCYHR